eukprot:m.441832 g.441832  ORF g.441832 m.441832 type:complete len:599 (-) comp56804_c0_seq2:189-1985(-)
MDPQASESGVVLRETPGRNRHAGRIKSDDSDLESVYGFPNTPSPNQPRNSTHMSTPLMSPTAFSFASPLNPASNRSSFTHPEQQPMSDSYVADLSLWSVASSVHPATDESMLEPHDVEPRAPPQPSLENETLDDSLSLSASTERDAEREMETVTIDSAPAATVAESFLPSQAEPSSSSGHERSLSSQSPPRTSAEGLSSLLTGEHRRVLISRSEQGFGFFLRGPVSKLPSDAASRSAGFIEKESETASILDENNVVYGLAGQYVRSVDMDGPAHNAGLLAGDRIVAVNNISCINSTHEEVKEMINSCDTLLLTVVYDDTLSKAFKTTTKLLKKNSLDHMNQSSGLPVLSAEMRHFTLGRTKSLKARFEPSSGTVAPQAPLLTLREVDSLNTKSRTSSASSSRSASPELPTRRGSLPASALLGIPRASLFKPQTSAGSAIPPPSHAPSSDVTTSLPTRRRAATENFGTIASFKPLQQEPAPNSSTGESEPVAHDGAVDPQAALLKSHSQSMSTPSLPAAGQQTPDATPSESPAGIPSLFGKLSAFNNRQFSSLASIPCARQHSGATRRSEQPAVDTIPEVVERRASVDHKAKSLETVLF